MNKNIQKLRSILKDAEFEDQYEALGLLDDIEDDIEDDYQTLVDELSAYETDADSLAEDLEDEKRYNSSIKEINTGIGIFKIDGSSNLLLDQIAEALESALKKNPNAVLTALEAL